MTDAAPPPAPRPTPAATEQIHVTAKRTPTPHGLEKLPANLQNTPQSIDVISQAAMKAQATTSVTDALRYAPGITLNSGEGGAHGDNINLRGFNAIDAFFLDGLRDPGSFTRDNFNTDSLQVLQGPASVLFGNGPAGGVVNQTSKLPSLATRQDATVETGTNKEARATIDLDEPIGPNAAIRLTAMGETTGVADRDYVQQRRWGIAPSAAFGLNTATTLTLAYFHQAENNIPDYGIPFLYGQPAPVNRSLYYGLKNYDHTQTNVNIGTVTLKHDFDNGITLTNTARYANYWANYRVSAPNFSNDYAGGAPTPGTPLTDILIYRDRPSSEGTQAYLTDHTDLTARFATGALTHTLIAGVEFGRQTTDYVRFDDDTQGVNGIAPTPLLAPNAQESAPLQNTIAARPNTASNMAGLYITDQIALTPQLSVDLGLRFDSYATKFDDSISGNGFHRTDSAISPRAALIYKPTPTLTFYADYTTSFDPAAAFLTLAPGTRGPAPESARTYEIGVKSRFLGGLFATTASIFRTQSANVTIADPDDPTLQQLPGNDQRVQGIELTGTGYLTDQFEIAVNYTYIDPEITHSATPAEIGKMLPGAARNTANLWATYEPNDDWRVSAGLNYVGHRYADSLNTANIPGYVVLNGAIFHQLTDTVHLQFNVQNLTDAKYFTGAYYSDATENHVLPGQGRVFTLSTGVSF